MMSLLLLLLAQTGGQGADMPPCNQAKADQGIQMEMNICAAHELNKADDALNAQWKITSAKMKSQDAEYEKYKSSFEPERPGYFESLLEAQRAWLKYRDAHCRLDGYNARGGSLEPLLVTTCKTSLTDTRTEELREIAEYPL